MVESTYRHNLQVVALEGFKQIGNSSLEPSIDEDAITEVVQQYGSQSSQITCQWEQLVCYILHWQADIFSSFFLSLFFLVMC